MQHAGRFKARLLLMCGHRIQYPTHWVDRYDALEWCAEYLDERAARGAGVPGPRSRDSVFSSRLDAVSCELEALSNEDRTVEGALTGDQYCVDLQRLVVRMTRFCDLLSAETR